MASIRQLRGALLEESILALLRAGGYRTVDKRGDDPTLGSAGAGLTVIGRGTPHQIDAIADLRVGQPFTNPQRLLVEAKFYADDRPVDLAIVRSMAGVLKDVSEYWVAKSKKGPAAVRYHYQVAIFSASRFTSKAQDYAFAQDIHLLPLRRSSNFSPVIKAIEEVTAGLPVTREGQVRDVRLNDVRKDLRYQLQPDLEAGNPVQHHPWLIGIRDATAAIRDSLVATLGHAFSVFLTPHQPGVIQSLQPYEEIEIHFRDQDGASGWTISRPGGSPLFTFDVPQRLFDHYAEEGRLSRRQAANLKEEIFNEFTAIYAPDDGIRLFHFRLLPGWIETLRRRE